MKLLKIFSVFLFVLFAQTPILAQLGDFTNSGRSIDENGSPVQNAMATYINLDKRLVYDFSDANGYFGGDITSVSPDKQKLIQNLNNIVIKEGMLIFDLSDAEKITIELFDINGREIANIFNRLLSPGRYYINTLSNISKNFSNRVYILRIKCGKDIFYKKLLKLDIINSFAVLNKNDCINTSSNSHSVIAKKLAVDEIRVGKTGYTPTIVSINSYSEDVGNVTIRSIDIESKIDSILALMSDDHKVGQLTQPKHNSVNTSYVTSNHIGSVFGGGSDLVSPNNPSSWASRCNSYYEAAHNSEIGIPILFGFDAVHGANPVRGSTIFPHNIGLGCTGDPKMVQLACRVTGIEVQGSGLNYTFAPTVAVPRNDRWGRTFEGYAETPELVEDMAEAAILGLQGTDLSLNTTIAACAKHYAGDGGTTNGDDGGNTTGNDYMLRSIHLKGFEAAVNAGCATIMASYSSWNGTEMHANSELITNTLKGTMGFNGFMQGDWEGHKTLGVTTCLNAGLDVPMAPSSYESVKSSLYSLDESRLNDAVRRVLRVKYWMGLFDGRLADGALTSLVGSQLHRDAARECVRKSLVLLKNNSVLPISKSSNVTVVGSHGNDIGLQCGGWTVGWQGSSGNITDGTTILQGVENICNGNVSYSSNGSSLGDPDVVIVVVGEQPYAEGMGDSNDLHLSSSHSSLINTCHSSGKPVVCILISGRPMIITDEIENCDAFVAAWLPGTEGDGIAEVLFGDYNFTGKLSHTWPISMDQIPINDGNMGDATGSGGSPLFEYGHGLSY